MCSRIPLLLQQHPDSHGSKAAPQQPTSPAKLQITSVLWKETALFPVLMLRGSCRRTTQSRGTYTSLTSPRWPHSSLECKSPGDMDCPPHRMVWCQAGGIYLCVLEEPRSLSLSQTVLCHDPASVAPWLGDPQQVSHSVTPTISSLKWR